MTPGTTHIGPHKWASVAGVPSGGLAPAHGASTEILLVRRSRSHTANSVK